ncbi:hypothetical protein COP1_011806 [Malus domestica]
MVIKCKSSPTRQSQQPPTKNQLKLLHSTPCFHRHSQPSRLSPEFPKHFNAEKTAPKRTRFIKAERHCLAFLASHFSLGVFQSSRALSWLPSLHQTSSL